MKCHVYHRGGHNIASRGSHISTFAVLWLPACTAPLQPCDFQHAQLLCSAATSSMPSSFAELWLPTCMAPCIGLGWLCSTLAAPFGWLSHDSGIFSRLLGESGFPRGHVFLSRHLIFGTISLARIYRSRNQSIGMGMVPLTLMPGNSLGKNLLPVPIVSCSIGLGVLVPEG